jgi:hypothetical protein
VNQKGKRISREDATDARAGWAGRAISACGDGAASGFLNLPMLWKFVEGNLGGILT